MIINIFLLYITITYGIGIYLSSLSYRDSGELSGYDWFIFALSPIFAPIIIIIALDSYFRERRENSDDDL